MAQEIRLPDIGDFKDVPIIEILVAPGQAVRKEQTLLTLESDKATLDVPAPEDGVIGEVIVKVGDKVSQGSLLATYASAGQSAPRRRAAPQPLPRRRPPRPSLRPTSRRTSSCSARALEAIRPLFAPPISGRKWCWSTGGRRSAASASMSAASRRRRCCMSQRPSTKPRRWPPMASSSARPPSMSPPSGQWKDGVVKRLTTGLTGLSRQRKVTVISGDGVFTSANTVRVETSEGARVVRFAKAIVAAGSEPVAPGFIPSDPRIWDSTDALEMRFVPKRMLVLGGGIIGLEMATVYRALGAGITVIEMMDQLMPGADADIVAPLGQAPRQVLRQYPAKDQGDGGQGREGGAHRRL